MVNLGSAALALYFGMMLAAYADYANDGPSKQQHRIETCQDTDNACKLAWWHEYKPAIIGEFKYWSSLKMFAESRDATVAGNAINEAIHEGEYRHHSWDFYRGVGGIEGVRPEEFEDVIDGCRAAIIEMKFWLIWVSDDKPGPYDDRAAYAEDAKMCMQAIGRSAPHRP